MISDVPEGASLSAGIDNGDGTWSLEPADLDGLSVTAPSDFSGSFDLSIEVTSSEADGDTAVTDTTLTVDVQGVADTPNLETASAQGYQNTDIPLEIASSLTDIDGSESLEIIIQGVPDGAVLSAGVDNGDGTWTLQSADLEDLSMNPGNSLVGEFQLEVIAQSTDGSSVAITESTIDIEIYPVEIEDDLVDEKEVPEIAPPTEIDWSGEFDLGIVTDSGELDRTIEQIDEKLEQLGIDLPEFAGTESEAHEPFLGELTPISFDVVESDDPLPPPDEPLFEYVRSENSDQIDAEISDEHQAKSYESIEHDSNEDNTKENAFGRLTSSFTMLWGLFRSLGVRDNNEDTHTSHHASRGKRE